MKLRFLLSLGLVLLTLTTPALAQVKDTDGDGLLDLIDVPGFRPNAREVHFNGQGIEDLDGANQLRRVTLISLNDNQIRSIERGDFDGLSNLRSLQLSGNQITSVDGAVFWFDGLSVLHNLDLRYNRIASIDRRAFNGLHNLHQINLASNLITSLESGDFEGLTNLSKLFLDDNQVTSLESGTFEGLPNLQVLSLLDNRITSIESGTFVGLPNLQSLRLDGNRLTSLESGDFEGLTNLPRLFLDDNQITSLESGTFEELPNLQSLVLIDNQITSIESGAFDGLANLQNLSLYGNRLTSIESGAFEELDNLTRLELFNNHLTSIESGAFAGLANLHHLSLSNNQIASIEDGAFAGLPNLQNLFLDGNELTELNLTDATFDLLIPCGTFDRWGFCLDSSKLFELIIRDAKLSSNSFDAIVGQTPRITDVALDGLIFTDEVPSLSRLLRIRRLTTVTVDPWLYDWYADEFEAFDEQEDKTVIVTPKDCNSDGQISILDANCISVNRVDNLLEDYGTVPGDADGMGGVEFADFLILQSNFGQSPAEYTDGDFDLDGEVGFSDFLVLSGNFGQGEDFTTGATAAVPEPSSLLGLLLAALLLFSCRKPSGI